MQAGELFLLADQAKASLRCYPSLSLLACVPLLHTEYMYAPFMPLGPTVSPYRPVSVGIPKSNHHEKGHVMLDNPTKDWGLLHTPRRKNPRLWSEYALDGVMGASCVI